MLIFNIIQELNKENGSNYKLSVLKKYQDNELLQRVLKMTYDKVTFTYGASVAQIQKFTPTYSTETISLEYALDILYSKICSRQVTGHAAYQLIADLYGNLEVEDADILKKIIDRDLKINLGKTQINKVWKNLIVKPVYMRCGVYNDKTKSKISFPAPIQLKADGTYREFNVFNQSVESRSRSGESYDYPLINNIMRNYPDSIYHGEITVILTDSLLEEITPKIQKIDKKNGTNNLEEITQAFNEHKAQNREYILPRSIGNGLVNSDEVPHENLKLELWDCVTHDEYENARNKVKNKTTYDVRFEKLKSIIGSIPNNNMIRIIPYKVVNNVAEALQQCSEWMNLGYEGGVLKDFNMVFRDGTSPQQLKMKLEIDLEVRCIGYKEGNPGTKREGKIGSLQFETDDKMIRGYCSGFSDDELDQFTENFDEICRDKIMTVQFNDLSKARGNNFYALSHPRYMEWRNDKTETDTLERAFELREMAMCLS